MTSTIAEIRARRLAIGDVEWEATDPATHRCHAHGEVCGSVMEHGVCDGCPTGRLTQIIGMPGDMGFVDLYGPNAEVVADFVANAPADVDALLAKIDEDASSRVTFSLPEGWSSAMVADALRALQRAVLPCDMPSLDRNRATALLCEIERALDRSPSGHGT